MDRDLILKITRLSIHYATEKTSKGVKRFGPYYTGVWRENGQERTVYIGKHLPRELKQLLNSRYKKPGYKTYTWPGQRA